MSGVNLPYGFNYETVAASQTAQVCGGAGAKGDILYRVVCVVATAATAATTIIDGSTSIALLPNSPGGGVGTYVFELSMAAQTGPWKITTGAGVSVIAVGIFSA